MPSSAKKFTRHRNDCFHPTNVSSFSRFPNSSTLFLQLSRSRQTPGKLSILQNPRVSGQTAIRWQRPPSLRSAKNTPNSANLPSTKEFTLPTVRTNASRFGHSQIGWQNWTAKLQNIRCVGRPKPREEPIARMCWERLLLNR